MVALAACTASPPSLEHGSIPRTPQANYLLWVTVTFLALRFSIAQRQCIGARYLHTFLFENTKRAPLLCVFNRKPSTTYDHKNADGLIAHRASMLTKHICLLKPRTMSQGRRKGVCCCPSFSLIKTAQKGAFPVGGQAKRSQKSRLYCITGIIIIAKNIHCIDKSRSDAQAKG